MAEGVTEPNIERSISPIHDRSWVVDQCLAALAPRAHVQSCLLQYGLAEVATRLQIQGTAPQGQEDKAEDADGDAAQLDWTCKWLQLLQQQERLATLQALSSGSVWLARRLALICPLCAHKACRCG